MKICYVGSVFPRHENDTEVPWLRRTIVLLKKQGHDVHVFAPSFKGLKSHSIDNIFVKRFRYFFAPWEDVTHDEGAPNKIHKFHYKIITLFYIIFGTLSLISYHRKEKFDLLHIHWPFPHGIFGFVAVFFYHTKIILNFHGASLLLIHKFKWVELFLRYFIKNADSIVVNSSFTAQTVKNIYKRKVHIIPYGTTILPKKDSNIKKQPNLLFSCGRMIERKGFTYLISAFESVHKKFPEMKLTIAGGGPIRKELQTQVERLNLSNYISLPGKIPLEELEQLYASSAMFILPSIVDSKGDTEGLGVVLIEAITYSLPIVASDVGGIPDVAINEKTAIVVPQKDSAALASAIIKLLENPKLCKRLVNGAKDHVKENFTWSTVIENLQKIYLSV